MIRKRLFDASGWRWQRERNRFSRLLGYLYGAWLTLRFVDSWETFPAIGFEGQIIRLKITKASSAKWHARGQLRLMRPVPSPTACAIILDAGSTFMIERTFWMGTDVTVTVRDNATLVIGGAEHQTGSGIGERSVIMVAREVTIGADCVISWNTFITDCDWHGRDGAEPAIPTQIHPHVWVGVGACVLKGSVIGRDSIVGANAVVTGGEFPARSLIGGSPARVLRADIAHWQETLAL